ncbi:hypothetical protein GZL_04070 [Streptomyces sp. 769]|nr:hypothetical protein GZL_04070 [Streptomyces sp. 769]
MNTVPHSLTPKRPTAQQGYAGTHPPLPPTPHPNWRPPEPTSHAPGRPPHRTRKSPGQHRCDLGFPEPPVGFEPTTFALQA